MYNQSSKCSSLSNSEIYLLEVHHSLLSQKNRIVKDLHYFSSGPVKVWHNFLLWEHLVGRNLVFAWGLTLEPIKKFLILLIWFKGVEDLCLFAEKAIGRRAVISLSFSLIHLVNPIILLIIMREGLQISPTGSPVNQILLKITWELNYESFLNFGHDETRPKCGLNIF